MTRGRAPLFARAALVALAAIPLLLASVALAVPYTLTITQPSAPDVSGTVAIELTVDGEASATHAAYVLVPEGQGWDEAGKTMAAPQGAGRFTGSLDTAARPNGTYTLHARAWEGSAAYDPGDPSTFAAASAPVRVSNRPPAPAGLTGRGGAEGVTLTWRPVATADRQDFAGYGVHRAPARSGRCPAFGDAYVLQDTVEAPRFEQGGLRSGGFCYRVTAVRTSPTTTTVASPPSDPVLVRAGGSGGAAGSYLRFGRAPGSAPPPPPLVPQYRAPIPDGPYSDRLPYGPAYALGTELAEPGLAGSVAEPGESPRHAMTLVAGGLLLLVTALHLRRLAAA